MKSITVSNLPNEMIVEIRKIAAVENNGNLSKMVAELLREALDTRKNKGNK